MSLPKLTIIPAGAGSGKTYTIQTRLAEWVRDRKVAPEKIVAVTFTEAAASELRDRIRAELVGQGRLEDALRLDQAYISTIHAFGLRVLTEFALDAGCNPRPRLLTEDEQGVLIRLALATTDRAEAIMDDLYRFGYQWDFNTGKGAEDKFRDGVLKVIRRLRTIGPKGNDSALAGLALDKVRTSYGVVDDAERLRVALQASIRNLVDRFPKDMSAFASTSGVAGKLENDYKQLRRALKGDDLKNDWKLWQRLRGLQTSTARNRLPDGYDELAEAVMIAADGLLQHPGPLSEALTHGEALFGTSQDSLAQFAVSKAERGLVDYTDMLSLALEMLAGRPEVLAALRERVDCLVIDEFQDTNPLQFALLWSLQKAGVPTLVVGDLKQAIMGFQDADPRLLGELQQQQADAVQPLTSNWRSHPQLMGWINAVGARLFGDAYTRLTPQANFPTQLCPLELMEFTAASKNEYRAEHTVARIKALLDDPDARVWDKTLKAERPIRGGDIAIISPTNPRLEQYASALRQLGIRARIEAGGWFGSRIVQLALHALAYVADPHERHAALYLAATELGEDSLEDALSALLDGNEPGQALLDQLKPLRASAADQMPATLLAEVIATLDLYGRVATWPEGEQARANLLRLEAQAREFVAANRDALSASGYYGTDTKTFLSWLEAMADDADAQPEPRVRDEEAVVLMTWHRSKGREWPVVAVCASDAEVRCDLPDVRVNYTDFSALDQILDRARLDFYSDFAAPEKSAVFRAQLWPEAVDSARRLLYVALTRAREKVILEWPVYLDNGKERQKFTFWEQLYADTGMTLNGNQLSLGGQDFDCRAVQVGKDRSPLFAAEAAEVAERLPTLGRRAIRLPATPIGLTPEAVRPSMKQAIVSLKPNPLQSVAYADQLCIDFDRPANVRGNILHRCFEVMDGNRDIERVSRAAGFAFTPVQFADLQARVTAFNAWLDGTLQPIAVRHEVPVLALDGQGSVITGFIDLLVETADGYWILDHKSDTTDDLTARFAEHLPQLLCYREALGKICPDKSVLGVGINWVSYGRVTLLSL